MAARPTGAQHQAERRPADDARHPGSANTTVTVTNDSASLSYRANLESPLPTPVPRGIAALGIDWARLTTTPLGAEFLPALVSRARIARYDEAPAELQANFPDLEFIAEETYEAAVTDGTSVAFDEFETGDGRAFTGIDSSGTWVLALFCDACVNPAPWYMTVLEPCN